MQPLQKIFQTNSYPEMAISNELSSEIAAALLSKRTSPRELKRLHDVILQVHNTLQSMERESSHKDVEVRAKATTHERDK